MLGPEYSLIEASIPTDHARPADADVMLDERFPDPPAGLRALDFGCGGGSGYDVLRARLPGLRYSGVDIESSPEVDARTRDDAEFRSFDGVNLPWEDGAFDLVYSRQVFEHVRHPDAAVQDIARVLKPGGVFLGSLSNLEPYHSFSIFNYTPYGVFRVLEDNGFRLDAMRPGPEGLSLMMRQLTVRRIRRFPLVYTAVEAAGRIKGWDARRRNYLKLRFSGHICFAATRL
ncbi:class I SAM-dependent methyltransferase [Rhodovulum sp. DZ06]|uniref:class I SAM-dependent methyltransferase n=1 Tax=Rhodovulum sp. DZ06 TaxID=3425126 RepID=UPI003D33DDDA